ncbi:UNVERIFIED_CONTAM: hypothetical protein POZ17_19615 [Ralstonia mannitolilytica]
MSQKGKSIYFSHISKCITEDECNMFIKAVSSQGVEAIGSQWLDWWFDYKNDPSNIIRPWLKEKMIDAAEKNSFRIANVLRKKLDIKSIS